MHVVLFCHLFSLSKTVGNASVLELLTDRMHSVMLGPDKSHSELMAVTSAEGPL